MPRLNLTPQQRLIVAADFKPNPTKGQGRKWVRDQVFNLAQNLQGTGVIIKVNFALRACGYELIDYLHNLSLEVFADLKLFDIDGTLASDGILLREAKPELLTVVLMVGTKSMRALKTELTNTEILGVSALTSLTNEDTQAMFCCSTQEAIMRFAKIGASLKTEESSFIDGFISAGTEAAMLRGEFGFLLSINTPAIRPVWSIVEGDDQNPDRIMTPAKAIWAGADRIVVGRPITQAKNPYDAVMRTIEEIKAALTA